MIIPADYDLYVIAAEDEAELFAAAIKDPETRRKIIDILEEAGLLRP